MIRSLLRKKSKTVPTVFALVTAFWLLSILAFGLSHASAVDDATGVWQPLGGPLAPGGKVNALVVEREFSGTVYLPQTTLYASIGAMNDARYSNIYRSDDGALTWQRLFTSTDILDALDVAGDIVYFGGTDAIYKSVNRGQNWKKVFSGPGSGLSCRFMGLVINPVNPKIVYAAGYEVDGNTNYSVVYRSQDGGNTWARVLATPKPAPNSGMTFVAMAVNPSSPDTVLVGGGETILNSQEQNAAIYRSQDGGDTWTRVFSVSLNTLAPITNLVVDPFAPTHLLAGTGSFGPTSNNVLRSTDDGLTWQSVQTNLGAGVTFSTIPNLAWALANNMALFVSNDGGASWANTGYGIQGDWWNSNYPILATEDALFAGGTVFGVWKSSNDGANWTIHSNGVLSVEEVQNIALVPDAPNRVYAGASQLGWITPDSGKTWVQPTGVGDQNWIPTLRFAANPADPAIVYAGISSGHQGNVLRSEDEGLTFSPVYTDPITIGNQGQNNINAIAAAPRDGSIVYAVGQNQVPASSGNYGVIVRSETGGIDGSWIQVFTKTNISFWSVAINPVKPTIAYVGGDICTNTGCKGEVYRTRNGGDTWTRILVDDSGGFSAIVVDYQKPNVLYGATHGYRVYKSVDGGENWFLVRRPPWEPGGNISGNRLAIDPRVPSHLYLGGWGYIGESTDGGATWTEGDAPINNGTPGQAPSSLAVANAGTTQKLYAGFTGLWRYVRTAPTPGAPVTLTLASNVVTVTSSSTLTLTALLVDQQENWVSDGTEITFAAPGVIMTTTAAVADGHAVVILQTLKPGAAAIAAASGSARASIPIMVEENHTFLPALKR